MEHKHPSKETAYVLSQQDQLLTIDFLAFVLINTIYILVKFIFTINDKDSKLFKIEKLNWTCLIIAIVVIGSWLFSIKELQEFISNLLPWGK